MRCQTTYIILGGLILCNGLAFSSPYLLFAPLVYLPPVELGVVLVTKTKNALMMILEGVFVENTVRNRRQKAVTD